MRLKLPLALLALGACSAGSQQSVDYYKDHKQERVARIDRCLASFDLSQDCRNAKQAQFDLDGTPAKNGEAIAK
jgi:hypothetical protein